MQKQTFFPFLVLVASCAAAAAFAQTGAPTPPDVDARAKSSIDVRNPSVNAAGSDICNTWNLPGNDLAECRRQWMDARTDADRVEVRNRYEKRAGDDPVASQKQRPAPEAVDASNDCDRLHLSGPDLSECRAQWKAAKTEADRKKLLARYEAISASPSSRGARVKRSPPEAPPANKTPPK